MDTTAILLSTAHEIVARAETVVASRPPIYKPVGISLAVASGLFIGVSFVLKKVGLLRANTKYDEVPGEGYGYLKNFYWWTGMTLMIVGEICNFVAYAFVDAILVTPLGALSVVITAVLSAIFLKERLSAVGKVGCFLCIIGSVVILLNAPESSSVANITEMQHFVIQPGFLSYAGVVILGSAITAIWVAPKYGKKSMLVYLSICSFVGGLSVVATQGLGAAIIAQINGTPQFNQWFLYVLFVFVIATLVTEIIYLNKALNLFNAALVTPTYYVFFTSATIVTSAILFQGFRGTAVSITTVVLGFLTICSGVVLLQLSKSAKDVPDAAVFAGDLDQLRTIAEQEQPESEPKADSIRGAAAIVRRLSTVRQKREMEEAKRLRDELHDLEPIGENERVEWDGLRRRRTTLTGRPSTSPRTYTPTVHPPLGMSHFPTEEELQEDENRPNTGGLGSSFLGSFRSRSRTVAPGSRHGVTDPSIQSPMHPVALTEIAIPPYKTDDEGSYNQEHIYGLPHNLHDQKTAYDPGSQHIHFSEDTSERTGSRGSSFLAPERPPNSARRQFSFHNVFRKSQNPPHHEETLASGSARPKGFRSRTASSATAGGKQTTEEERLGLVKGDTNSHERFPDYEDGDEEEDWGDEDKKLPSVPPPPPEHRELISRMPPRKFSGDREEEVGDMEDVEEEKARYEGQRRKWQKPRSPPPPFDDGRGGAGADGAFI